MDFKYLFDRCATSKVLDFMIETPGVYNQTEIAAKSGITLASAIRVLRKLHEIGVVTFNRKMGNSKLYEINNESGIVILFKQIKNV